MSDAPRRAGHPVGPQIHDEHHASDADSFAADVNTDVDWPVAQERHFGPIKFDTDDHLFWFHCDTCGHVGASQISREAAERERNAHTVRRSVVDVPTEPSPSLERGGEEHVTSVGDAGRDGFYGTCTCGWEGNTYSLMGPARIEAQRHSDAASEPTPNPRPWTELVLIDTGGGAYARNITEIVPEEIRGAKRWASLDDQDEWFTDDEIAALGPVRRAEVITLPDWNDSLQEMYGVEQGRFIIATHDGAEDILPGDARQLAAELLAAANQAESAGGEG